MLDLDWFDIEKKVDPNFVGSVFDQMGFEKELCPTCGAHLRGGICLNACHLTKTSQKKFSELMKRIAHD
jgi:hypothetical protein